MASPGAPANRTRRYTVAIGFLVTVCLLIALLHYHRHAESTRPRERNYLGSTMGTTYSVKAVLTPELRSQEEHIAQAIALQLDDVNQKMSTYRNDSELSRFNQSTSTEPFAVSRETAEVVAVALKVSEASDGAFDVTVGPLVNAWGFGPPEVGEGSPSDEELAALRERIGYRKLSVDVEACTIRKARPDVYCDLSAIAKGYASDKVAAALAEFGVDNYMVEVGGEVRVGGQKLDGSPWRIAVEKPDPSARVIERVLELTDVALATSGDYRNFFMKGGMRFSHTIDPRTGRPVAHRLASVSVLHAECALADAYATAIMVLGPEEGFAMAEREGLAALLLVHDDQGGFTPRATAGFEAQSGE